MQNYAGRKRNVQNKSVSLVVNHSVLTINHAKSKTVPLPILGKHDVTSQAAIGTQQKECQ